MSDFSRPKVVVSKCLGFEACRYNGEKLHDRFLDTLKGFVDYVFVCPEVEIGLGVPRDPIRLVSFKQDPEQLQLLQPATERDVTQPMQAFSERFVESLREVDGFVLKSASPTCAIKDAKFYSALEKSPAFGRGPGLFGKVILDRFSDTAVEDEGRLNNLNLREHFLTRIFAFCRLRGLSKNPSMGRLVDFHSRNKFLLMCYNQTEMRELGRIVANPQKEQIDSVMRSYDLHFRKALARAPRHASHINVLMHGFGYVSEHLSAPEKAHFLDLLEKYRSQQLPAIAPVTLLRSWLLRFEVHYLIQQSYFDPFPEKLVMSRDSGRGRAVQ